MSLVFKNREVVIQVLQFSLIGGLNALIDIGSLNLLLLFWPTENSLFLLLFNTIAYLLAITNSYIWNSNWTFRKTSSKNRKEAVYFLIQALASLIISNIVFVGGAFLLAILAIPTIAEQNIAKGSAMIISSAASFIFMRYFVFKKHRKPVKIKKVSINRYHPAILQVKKGKLDTYRR
ncbi:GtrA family protein [Oceanobacillus halophilus]|uniref:GtrA family protein n=1 Tax=Oceanobacillus halophilus TaxID=930130 RepID=A0A495A2L7_9BACI|nr:GtrA family protein [Oceanobacillus halophilus]RKQ33527.1 GtrA family protein [Oceanobacillus halophilus]